MEDVVQIVDRATGVPGDYCIRRMKGGYAEYWSPRGWAAFAYVFKDRVMAEAVMKLLVGE